MTAVVTLGGESVSSVRLHVPNVGPWFADVDFVDSPTFSGRQTLKIGERSFVGTIDPREDGTFGGRRRCRLVAGAGGWGKALKAKPYHNDAGVKARAIADDAAREVGETIGTFTPGADRVGVDYVREAREASTALEDAAGGVPWWVDYAGVTHVNQRPTTKPAAGAYDLIEYAARERVALLVVDDLAAVGIGSVLSERLDAPQTVRELEITISSDGIRVRAWCGGVPAARGRLAGALQAIVERLMSGRLFGKYRYRVVKVAGDARLTLQAVHKRPGLPDMVPIAVWPGFAAGEVNPREASEALVEFIEGDRAQPIVTGFATETGGVEVAYKGASVEILLPPCLFSGTVAGAPATGVLTFPLTKTLGAVTGGTPHMKVKVD
jgi:hypothetical protein